jgi:hypothetical protein
MNRARTEFLERNTDPQIKSYLFGQGHCCDIPQGETIDEFEYHLHSTYFKNKLVNGILVSPRVKGEWSEDKLWFVSFSDAEFFVKWYNQNHNASAILTEFN